MKQDHIAHIQTFIRAYKDLDADQQKRWGGAVCITVIRFRSGHSLELEPGQNYCTHTDADPEPDPA